MTDMPRSLDEIEAYLSSGKPLTPDEPRRILLELARYMVRQQKEHEILRAEMQKMGHEMLTPAKLAEHQKRFG